MLKVSLATTTAAPDNLGHKGQQRRDPGLKHYKVLPQSMVKGKWGLLTKQNTKPQNEETKK